MYFESDSKKLNQRTAIRQKTFRTKEFVICIQVKPTPLAICPYKNSNKLWGKFVIYNSFIIFTIKVTFFLLFSGNILHFTLLNLFVVNTFFDNRLYKVRFFLWFWGILHCLVDLVILIFRFFWCMFKSWPNEWFNSREKWLFLLSGIGTSLGGNSYFLPRIVLSMFFTWWFY